MIGLFSKHAGKLANSWRKRRREWAIKKIGRSLFRGRTFNEAATVTRADRSASVATAMPYDEKYFEPRYGDMGRKTLTARRVLIDVYECYAVIETIATRLGRNSDTGAPGAASSASGRAPNTLKILDIGCNNGYLVLLLRELGFEAYGVDASEYALRLAPQRVKPFLYFGSFADLPFADKSFDLAVSWGTIEHLPESDSDACLKEAIRVSREAMWIGCDNVPQSIEPYHLTNHPIDWWERKLEKLGQKVDGELRDAIRHHPFLWKTQFYWDALECRLR